MGERVKAEPRLFLTSLIIFCLVSLPAFAKSEKIVTNLYGHYLKGLVSLEKGDYRVSLKELQKAKKLDPDSFFIRLRIATLLIRLGELDKAERELKEAKKIESDNFDASLALIFLYSYSQKDEKLEKEYAAFLEKAHQIRPQDARISEHLAQFYFYKNKTWEAVKIYEILYKNNPEDIDTIFWLGFLYEEAGNRKQAVSLWEKGAAINGGYAPILNSLGYIYAEEGTNLDQAEEMIKKALEQESENGAYLDSLGWVYFKKKDYEKAKEYLTMAVNAVKDPVIYGHLGDIYAELGDFEKAVMFLKEGLNYFPEDKNLRKQLEKYE